MKTITRRTALADGGCPYLTEFLENYQVLPPDAQEFLGRVIAKLRYYHEHDPDVATLSAPELIAKATREVAPDRPDFIAAAERMAGVAS